MEKARLIEVKLLNRNKNVLSAVLMRMCFFLIFSDAVCFAQPNFETTLTIPLEYGFSPDVPHWGAFGSIDTRTFDVKVPTQSIKELGRFISEDGYEHVLKPGGDFSKYFGQALYSILRGYGITVSSPNKYELIVTPVQVTIGFISTEDDGEKVCTVKIKAVLVKDKETVLFETIVENVGQDEFDSDDEEEYARLLDMTIHGAIVKLWASRILFTDVCLGKGSVVKKDLGVYGFVPGEFEKDLDINDSTFLSIASSSTNITGQRVMANSGIYKSDTDNSKVEKNVLVGAYAEKDSVVVDDGKKITIGILPFENATGQEKLTAVTKEIREVLQVELSKSHTVKVMDREKLSDILREQALGLTGALNDSTVVQVGNISGLRAMVAGKLTTSGSYYRVSARILNVETSAIIAAVSVNSSDANQISDAVPELAAKLLYAFTEEKLEINRNSMSYPAPCPVSMPAMTASVEDAWAIEFNPAALMKVRKRDANFFISFAKTLSGELDSLNGPDIETTQPPFEKMGVNVALPLGLRFASGFGIQHQYAYPMLKTTASTTGTQGIRTYDIKEEETVFTLPLAFGINPKLSFGTNIRMHILEYQVINPGFEYRSGNAMYADCKAAALFNVSERFRAGMTYQQGSFYMRAGEKTDTSDEYKSVSRKIPSEFRFGTAMYPWKWCFFFADLEYEKQPDNERIQPGFHLGLQFTYTGKPLQLAFMPQYGMIPLYIGYSHEPYVLTTDTQAKYLSFGTGYFLNNIYVQWSLRFNVEKESQRKAVVGIPGKSTTTIYDYSLVTPLFLCIGYRF